MIESTINSDDEFDTFFGTGVPASRKAASTACRIGEPRSWITHS